MVDATKLPMPPYGGQAQIPATGKRKRKPREPKSSGFALSDNPPKLAGYFAGSPGRTRTADKVVNSHPLYQLSYRGIISILTRWL